MLNVKQKNENIDLSFVDQLVAERGRGPEQLIGLLQAIQQHFHYLPEAALRRLCEISENSPATVAGVATFYTQFRLMPAGQHLISVCHGTACHVKGAGLIDDALRRALRLAEGEDTDADGIFTLQKVACLGCCTLAPVFQIDGITYGHQTPDMVEASLKDFLALEKRGLLAERQQSETPRGEGLTEIRVGVGSCCVAGGSQEVREALERAVRQAGAPVLIKPVGCVGMCHRTPLVEVLAPGQQSDYYACVRPQAAERIVQRHFRPPTLARRVGRWISTSLDHLLSDENWEPVTRYALDVRDAQVCAFLGRQQHLATEESGRLDPLDLDEYVAHDGFQALRACLRELSPDAVIETVKRAGLRGRGGAGFPTGEKWDAYARRRRSGEVHGLQRRRRRPRRLYGPHVAGIVSLPRPGRHGHRRLRRRRRGRRTLYSRRVSPGRAAHARGDSPLRGGGFLGAKMLGTGFTLRLRVMEGAGAFVCGEETALLASIEGRRGMPRLRPPLSRRTRAVGQAHLHQ